MPKQAKPEDIKKRIEDLKEIENSSSEAIKHWAFAERVKLENKLK